MFVFIRTDRAAPLAALLWLLSLGEQGGRKGRVRGGRKGGSRLGVLRRDKAHRKEERVTKGLEGWPVGDRKSARESQEADNTEYQDCFLAFGKDRLTVYQDLDL